jgi:adenylate kinase family enzyme
MACSRHDGVVVQRVSIVGNAGSGKSRLGRRIAEKLGVPFVELDAIYHLQNWQPLAADLLAAKVTEIAETDGWVVDGNYRSVVVEGPVWRRAEMVVWLDLPRRTVMRQVTTRTVRRLVTRQHLWNGNREPWSNLYRWDPETSVIRWAWTQHRKYQERYEAAMTSPQYAHIAFVRLTGHAAADAWLEKLRTAE